MTPTQTLPLVHDFTALSSVASCPRMYFYEYVRRLREPGVNVPMKAGSAMHEALAILYGEKWDLNLAKEALREAYGGFRPPPASKHSYLTIGHLEIALENYVRDREESPTILEEAELVGSGVEGAVTFDWPNADGEIITLGGKPDLAVEVGGQRYIVDHKTTTQNVNRWWAKGFSISHQFKIYVAMMQQVYALPFDGAYVNAIHLGSNATEDASYWKGVKSAPNALFGPFNYSPSHLRETRRWAEGWMEMIESLDPEDPEDWPQNERACGDYGGCEFLPLCELPPAARKGREKAQYEEWTPGGVLVSGADSD